MGEIRLYKCKCGYEKKLNIGAGLHAHNLRIIEKIFKEDATPIIEDTSGEASYDMTSVLGKCNSCKELLALNKLEYKLEGDNSKEIIQQDCNVCGEMAEIVDDSKVFCPKCGQEIQYEEVGHWD